MLSHTAHISVSFGTVEGHILLLTVSWWIRVEDRESGLKDIKRFCFCFCDDKLKGRERESSMGQLAGRQALGQWRVMKGRSMSSCRVWEGSTWSRATSLPRTRHPLRCYASARFLLRCAASCPAAINHHYALCICLSSAYLPAAAGWQGLRARLPITTTLMAGSWTTGWGWLSCTAAAS
jgi:hypothetical protein